MKVENEKQLKQLVSDWLTERHPAQVVLLNGPMGVGKTRFVQLACEILNAEGSSSPSFAIHNEYKSSDGVIDHLDLFRIESESDLESTGFWDLFDRKQGLIFIEWAERLGVTRFSKRWKVTSVRIDFVEIQPSSKRMVTLEEL